jgi:hypothetical protein
MEEHSTEMSMELCNVHDTEVYESYTSVGYGIVSVFLSLSTISSKPHGGF